MTKSEIYEALLEKAVLTNRTNLDEITPEEKELLFKEKTIIVPAGSGCGHYKYQILSNPHRLNDYSCALVASKGNLQFGFRRNSRYLIVLTN